MSATEEIFVAKFGGSSVIKYPEKIKEIAEAADAKRTFIVVSAPGKAHKDDTKLTDILFGLVEDKSNSEDPMTRVLSKLEAIGIPFDKAALTEYLIEQLQLADTLSGSQRTAHIVSLGEDLAAQVYSEYLGATYLDPKELFVLDAPVEYTNAKLNFAASAERWKDVLPTLTDSLYIVPGYYGATYEGSRALFSRGGSDLTGAYVAYFTEAAKYENFTDSPILAADPRIITDPKQIDTLTFKELRDLTYSGFSILHPEVVAPLAEKDIAIEIRSTANFPEPGTHVVTDRVAAENIVGVAFTDGYVPLKFYQAGLHEVAYALSDILLILRKLEIPVEHISTSIDDVTIIVPKDHMTTDSLEKIRTEAKRMFGKNIEVHSYEDFHLGLLTVVGHGMRQTKGISGEIQKTLAYHDINIYGINQSLTERNIIYCIESEKASDAIKGIYERFIA